MTIARRHFTFASLALALAPAAARAASPQQAQAANPIPEVPVAPLAAEWTLRKRGDELLVGLVLINVSDAPVEILTARGSRPGPQVDAALQVDGELVPLEERYETDKFEVFSRRGPIPRYEVMAKGDRLPFAEWRFALPAEVEPEPVRMTAQIQTADDRVTLVQGGLRWDARAGT